MLETITKQRAEDITGFKLDGRRKYGLHKKDGVFELLLHTEDCWGCTEYLGDGAGSKIGPSGCEQCGYTGKRRSRDWVPVVESNLQRRLR